MSEVGDAERVELPADVVSRIRERLPHTEFDDVGEYVAYVLEEVLYHVEQERDRADTETVDEEQVRERLRSLGYLNE